MHLITNIFFSKNKSISINEFVPKFDLQYTNQWTVSYVCSNFFRNNKNKLLDPYDFIDECDNIGDKTPTISLNTYYKINSKCVRVDDTELNIPTILDQTITLFSGQCVVIKRAKAIKYYKLTEYMAQLFSKDSSTKVGALFMYPGTLQILSMGYNGMPRNVIETKERTERPLKYKFTEHAERNAIYNAAQSGTPLRDSVCVTSLCPCTDCTRGIIQSGCKMVITMCIDDTQRNKPDVVSRWRPDWHVSICMMHEAGVQIMFLTKAELEQT